MLSFLKLLVLVPLALIAVAFAVANRQVTTVSFDPFATDVPAFALSGPLFLVLLITVVFGVVLGGVGAWLGQGRHRKAVRITTRDNDDLRREIARLKQELAIETRRGAEAAAGPVPAGPYPALPGQHAA